MQKKPSVTALLDLLNKPALLKWANNIGLQGISLEASRAKSKAQGFSLHKQIELFFKEGELLQDDGDQNALDKFLRGKKVISYENSIETDWFVGRYDLELQSKDETYLCDFKSSTGVYLETILQLTAYRMARKVDKIAVISIPDFYFKPVEIKDFTPYEEILKSLSNIYRLKGETGWK